MNIFVLDQNPFLAAQAHCDKHLNKMLSETAQMLSTAVWDKLVSPEEKLYWKSKDLRKKLAVKASYKKRTGLFLPSHTGHICNKWCAQTQSNFEWLYNLGLGLEEEWKFRRNKGHKSAIIVHNVWQYKHVLPPGELTPFAQAFRTKYPELIDPNDPVGAYRNFYVRDKHRFATWNWGRLPPEWYISGLRSLGLS